LSQSPSCVISPLERKGNDGSFRQHSALHSLRSLDPDTCSEKSLAVLSYLLFLSLHFIDLHACTRTAGGTFLVCVHNVSKEQPYIILRASINSTASDIIKQVFLKLRRMDASVSEYVLLEETVKDVNISIPKSQQPSPSLQVSSKDVALSRKKSAEGWLNV
uniref:Ras-associating domain-containing protein n=1 Tax=Gongylonema pulchrum TaxID=637853 RepID=A0A183EV31_9BILA